MRGCLSYGGRTGHGHEEAAGEQVQGGVRQGNEKQKGEVLDRLVAVGMGRSTARRLLSQAVGSEERPGPGRGRRPKYGEETQRLLERLWLLMGMPCGPYMKAMLDQWIPALRADGELDDVDGTRSSRCAR